MSAAPSPGSFLQNIWFRINPAVQYLPPADAEMVRQALAQPTFRAEFQIPVRMDSGKKHFFTGFRSQYRVLRPTKGGIRFHPEVHAEEVDALALGMLVKVNALDLPFGGAKGGVIVDPKTLSRGEREGVSRGYFRHLRDLVGPDMDVPAPDVGTGPFEMDCMANEDQHLHGQWRPAVITGKSVERGGIVGRGDATARGAFYLMMHDLEERGEDPKGKKVAIQGFGNAGEHFATLAASVEMVIVGISDSQGSVIDPHGIDVEEAVKLKKRNALSYTTNNPRDVLTLEGLDILAPAALENQIDAETAGRISAGQIFELANGPTMAEADRVFIERGVKVFPDALANAGGVTVSYFEWVQGKGGDTWELDRVHNELRRRMLRNYGQIAEIQKEHGIDLRTATYVHSLRRIAGSLNKLYG